MVNAQELINEQTSAQDLINSSSRFAVDRIQDKRESLQRFQKDHTPLKQNLASGKSTKKIPSYLKGKSVSVSKQLQGIGAFLTGPQVIAGNAGYSSGSSSGAQPGRGRGRPMQSFTPKMLPDGTVVSMPVQAYKRAVSMQRAQMRLQNELAKQQMLNAQPSASEMPRGYGQYSAEDSFAGQDGPSAIQEMQMRQMQQQMAQQNQPQAQLGMMQRFTQMFGMPQQQQGPRMVSRAPMGVGMGQTSSRMPVWNGGGLTIPKERNILNAPNVFNRQGGTTIGVARQQQQY